MRTSEQKRIIVNGLKPFFKENKIKGKDIWELRYDFNIPNKESQLHCGLSFSNYDSAGFAYGLQVYQVEKLIKEVGFPNSEDCFVNSKPEESPLITINGTGFMKKKTDLLHFKEECETVESYEIFSQEIINYLQTDGQRFIETYTHLPNVLKKMDELENAGKYWHEIISGGPENLFRGLIISKLCNDINYNEKVKYVDKIFYDDPDEWLPYYEKLKERLKTVEPKYNV